MATLKPPWCNDFGEPAAAMFHIASSNETPQIPEHLSPEAHDFLLRCFKREPKERPDAIQLLNHAFIIGQQHVDVLPPVNMSPDISYLNNVSPLSSTATNNIKLLPTDLLLNIFCFIDPRDHSNVAAVCKVRYF
jgi:serine/threonine protein kinase